MERLPRARSYPVAPLTEVQLKDAVPETGAPRVSSGTPAGALALQAQGPSVSPATRASSSPCGKSTETVSGGPPAGTWQTIEVGVETAKPTNPKFESATPAIVRASADRTFAPRIPIPSVLTPCAARKSLKLDPCSCVVQIAGVMNPLRESVCQPTITE